jgi:hypothetical protein
MRREDVRVKPYAFDPASDEPRVLTRRHAPIGLPAPGEEELTRFLA